MKPGRPKNAAGRPLEAAARPSPDGPDLLVDRFSVPVRTLRLSITDRCNHRCRYCMPARGIDLLPRSAVMSIEQTVAVAEALVSAGIRRVRLTGGEPLVRSGALELVSRVARIRGIQDLAMTTNGSLLAGTAGPLRQAGLGRINISLDTLDPDRFQRLTLRADLATVVAGIDAAVQAGFGAVHLNTVAVAGFNQDEFWNICRFAWDRAAVPRFIELMPTGPSGFWSSEKFISADAVVKLVEQAAGRRAQPLGTPEARGPARYFDLGQGRAFGVIASVTGHICERCDRIRVRATGELQTCLMRPPGPDLRQVLARSGPRAMIETTIEAIREKNRRPEELTGTASSMSRVGG